LKKIAGLPEKVIRLFCWEIQPTSSDLKGHAMKRKGVTGIFGCLALLLLAAVAFASPVPDTGQTKCYNVVGDEITCPSPGQALYGQDANYSINPPSYTKLGSNGAELPDSATVWAMIKDNVTGLIWENKQSRNGVKDYANPHDADNTYTWYDPTDPHPGTPGDGTDTKDFLDALNNAHFGGYSDWRLPTIKDLTYIVNCSTSNIGLSINTSYFSNTQSAYYWSSTTFASDTSSAWGVDFYFGYDYIGYKYYSLYVRAVRGGQSGSFGNLTIGPFDSKVSGSIYEASAVIDSFKDNGNGTVTDISTGLMWQQNTPDVMKNWDQALADCESLSLSDYLDWRLPTIMELRSLVEYSIHDPAINTTFFPDTVSSFYWSSTTYPHDRDYAWGLNFSIGRGGTGGLKSSSYYVRAVRGGQSRILGHLIILSPNQADKWDIGSQKVISWVTQNIAGNVKISISRDGGKNYTPIVASTPNDGSYPWTVAGPASVNCMIKIEPLSDLTKDTVQGLFAIVLKGDVNADGKVDLTDAILSLQVLSGLAPDNINPAADVNGDGKIGMAEAIYVMQKVAGLR
jgi:hypothetical protein